MHIPPCSARLHTPFPVFHVVHIIYKEAAAELKGTPKLEHFFMKKERHVSIMWLNA
jgi:hypothetical protein